jgi:hypothetical protein
MRDVVASVLLAFFLACAWASYVAVTSFGGAFRVLEGTVFFGVPCAVAASVTALLAPALASRLRWHPLPAYLLLGLLCGGAAGVMNAISLSSEMRIGPSAFAEQLAMFAMLGLALGVLVLGVSRLVRSRTPGA